MNYKFDLDNLFSRYGLGEILLENNTNDSGMWKTDEHDYVTIRIPMTLRKRFDVFWERAGVKLGIPMEPYHVQEGIPFTNGLTMLVTFYFIPVETAQLLLQHFHEIVSPEINDPNNWQYDWPRQTGAM